MNIFSNQIGFSEENKELQYFQNAFLEYFDPLCFYAFRYVENTDASEDIVQDVFFDIWTNKSKIDFSRPLKPLLYKLTKNKSIDFLRSARHHEEKLDESTEGLILESYVRDMIINQEDLICLQELSQEIQSCVDNLPEQCKKVFMLSRTAGLKNKEVAEHLGISIKAVEKQITKALSEIRLHLNKEDLISFIFFFNLFHS